MPNLVDVPQTVYVGIPKIWKRWSTALLCLETWLTLVNMPLLSIGYRIPALLAVDQTIQAHVRIIIEYIGPFEASQGRRK